MNNKQTRRDVMKVVESRGVITGSGNVLGQLCKSVRAEGVPGRDAVLDSLDSLERSGRIEVERQGKIIHVVRVARPQRPDRAEYSAQSKREHTFTRDTPVYLTDEMCSPVISITRESEYVPTPADIAKIARPATPEQELAEPEVVDSVSELPLHEQLTLGLLALREAAGVEGMFVGSCTAVLRTALPTTPSRANQINTRLKALGLRSSRRLGLGANVEHTIDLTVEEVTPKMLQRPSSAEEKQADPMMRLAEIIEKLEADKTSLEQQLVTRDRDLAGAKEENARLRQQVADFEVEQRNNSQLDSRVTDILSRYE